MDKVIQSTAAQAEADLRIETNTLRLFLFDFNSQCLKFYLCCGIWLGVIMRMFADNKTRGLPDIICVLAHSLKT